jgi:hypothetical protein
MRRSMGVMGASMPVSSSKMLQSCCPARRGAYFCAIAQALARLPY